MKRLVTGIVLSLALLSACKEDPSETHHRIAVDLYAKGDFAKAAAEYEETIKYNPAIEDMVYKKAASAWMKSGDKDKAAALLEKLANKKEGVDKLGGYRDIASMYMSSADYDHAEIWFKKCLDADPKDDVSLGWLAEISAIRGGARNTSAVVKPEQLDQALKLYDQAIAMKPESVNPYINKRVVFIRYLDYLSKQKTAALADAETNKADKQTAADFKADADRFQAKYDDLKAQLDAVSAKIGEINKAAKAAQAAPAADGGK